VSLMTITTVMTLTTMEIKPCQAFSISLLCGMSGGMHWGGLFSSFRILLHHVGFLALSVENASDFKKATRLG
jgi:hypothetical protein